MSEGLNKHKEELLDGLTERVVEQLTPVVNAPLPFFHLNVLGEAVVCNTTVNSNYAR